MKRKIYSQLLRWKKTEQGRVALLIDGARRVGKSYIVEQFARNEYKSYIFIDFNSAGRDIHELFADKLSTSYVIHTKDFREQDGVHYLPIYMTPLL